MGLGAGFAVTAMVHGCRLGAVDVGVKPDGGQHCSGDTVAGVMLGAVCITCTGVKKVERYVGDGLLFDVTFDWREQRSTGETGRVD